MDGKQAMSFSFLFLLSSISFAQMSNINTALASLCGFFVDLLPIISMLVVVAGGAIYAGGQLMGAETRARANVWATALLTGALIGILISVLGPFVMQTMYGGTWTTACQGTGGGGGTPCSPNPCTTPPNTLCCQTTQAGATTCCNSNTQKCCAYTTGTPGCQALSFICGSS